MTTLRIVHDNEPSNPRTDYDNFCLMACVHGRYDLGDKNSSQIIASKLGVSVRDYTLATLIEMAHKKGLIFTSKPLYLYDHSGITMATTPFSCKWDSGQVGEILIFKEEIKAEFGIKRMGKKVEAKMRELAERHIEGEVASYDAYLTGDVYSLQILDEDGNVEEDLSGFVGRNIETNGMLESIDKSMIEALRACEVSYA